MEKSKSLLNPKAAPYVPLSKTAFGLGFQDEDKALASTSTSSSEPAFHYDLVDSSSDGIQNLSIIDREPSSSENMCDLEEYIMRDFIQCEEHLLNLFPDISKESLADVFYCNDGDLEDTIAMLEELESNRFNKNVGTSDDKGPLKPKCNEAIEKDSS